MPGWSDFGGIWTTLRDIDVNAVREEAERPLAVGCVGHDAALAEVERLLSTSQDRFPAAGPSPLMLLPLERTAEAPERLRGASLLVLAVDARRGLTTAEGDAFARAEQIGLPFMVAVVFGGLGSAGLANLPPAVAARAVAIPEPQALDAADRLAAELLRRLPSDLHLAAARRLPGLRAVFARELIASTSFANATYALASGLPEQIPILSVPFAAADILVLTKNQAMLVYRLALGHGAPPGFQERIAEVLPVVGGAFLWRQAARSLIGLIPVWGLLPKVAVAYAGTYTTGVAAWRWYERGELASSDQLRRISAEALALGRQRAAEIIERARATGSGVAGRAQTASSGALGRARTAGAGLWDTIRRRLPRRRAALPPSSGATPGPSSPPPVSDTQQPTTDDR